MAQTARRVVTEVHDEPHLEGRRVTVRRVRALVEEADESAAAVAERFDLDVADVYAALTYYHTHPEEMEAAEHTRQERETAARESDSTSLGALRREHDEEADGVSDSG